MVLVGFWVLLLLGCYFGVTFRLHQTQLHKVAVHGLVDEVAAAHAAGFNVLFPVVNIVVDNVQGAGGDVYLSLIHI